jgi:autotransporter-associated beta strand protein
MTLSCVIRGMLDRFLAFLRSAVWLALPSVAHAAVVDPAVTYAWYQGGTGIAVGSDGYAVSSWTNSATTGTPSLRNLTSVSGAPIRWNVLKSDGSPGQVLRFNGNSDGLFASSSNFGTISGSRTIVAWIRPRETTRGFLFDSSTFANGLTRAQVNNGSWQVSTEPANGTAANVGTTTGPVTTNTWQAHTFILTTGTPATFQHFINGTQAGTTASLTQAAALSGLILGNNVAPGGGLGFDVDVAEVLVYNSALNPTDRQEVESYLTTKWSGLSDGVNDPPEPLTSTSQPFASGLGGYHTFRIPAIATTNAGTLIVAADGRVNNSVDIPSNIDSVIRRSTDNGSTWGPLIVTADYGTNASDTDSYQITGSSTPRNRNSASDPALLVDRSNGRIWIFYDNGSNHSYNGYGRTIKLEMRYSDDDGLTWSARKDIEAENPNLRPKETEQFTFNGNSFTYGRGEYIVGPGNGIQIERGPNAGRLVFPVYWFRTNNNASFIYSDDHGATWQRGGTCGTGVGEIQITELVNGDLLASMRPSGAASGYRWFSRSSDGGVTWSAMFRFDATAAFPVPDPACQGNIFRLTTTADSDRNRLVHANCASTGSRVAMTLRTSYDEGLSWPVSRLVYGSSSAYSSLTKLSNSDIGLLYEKNNYTAIDFVRVSLPQATNQTDALPPYTLWANTKFSSAQLMNAAISGQTEDPDGDGNHNLVEFQTGTNPLISDNVSPWTGPDLGKLAIIGDSITQASGSGYSANAYGQNACRGYRWHLFKNLVDAGAKFDFVGSINTNFTSDAQYPSWRSMQFDRSNEGHFGWRAFQIRGTSAGNSAANRGSGNISQWLDPKLGGYIPDTVTMMIGINDFGDGRTPTQVRDDVAAIIDTIQTANPKVRIHLIEVLHVGSGHAQYPGLNTTVDTYNTSFLPALASSKTTATSTVTVVPMLNGQSGGFLADEMTHDQVHPNSRGEAYIAARLSTALGLTSQWTPVAVTNGNFESAFTGSGLTLAPGGWTLYGSPGVAPLKLTDYSAVTESRVDLTATGVSSTAGSSYVIAGTADTGIKQTLSETLIAGKHYMLQVSAYSGSAALTAGDWAVEVWAGATKVGEADNKRRLLQYTTGTASQIGSRLTELTVEFLASDFPTAIGEPLEIRLISKHAARYVGFDDVRLSSKAAPGNGAPKALKVYILTGQSNSLGTTNGSELDRLPGLDPADDQIRFWWANVADATSSLGSSGGFFKPLQAQQGNNFYTGSETHWGPEIGFGRALHHAGERDFVIIKASRGGGGNTNWDKASSGHMYDQVVNTVTAACNRLTSQGHSVQIAGLLHLQGESNTTAEATLAGSRFKTLIDNLRTDLPNASGLKGYMIGNVDSSADDATTRTQQEAIAAANPSYLFYADSLDQQDELNPVDNLHHNKRAKLSNGARFARMVLGTPAGFNAAAGFAAPYGIGYGLGSAGIAPDAGIPQNLSACHPVLQGWSEERSTVASSSQTNASLLPDPVGNVAAFAITDADTSGSGYYYSSRFTATQTAGFATSGWRAEMNARFPTAFDTAPSVFLQYGDASSRWRVEFQRSTSGSLNATFIGSGGPQTVALQASYDNAYHRVSLRRAAGAAGTAAELVFDGGVLGQVSPTAIDATLEPGVHFGTQSASGQGVVHVASLGFTTQPATPEVSIRASDPEANESSDSNAAFTVSVWPTPAVDLVIPIVISGSATSGSDFTALASSVTIPAGTNSVIIPVSVLGDNIGEGPETLIATLSEGSGYTLVPTTSATITIQETSDTVTITASDPNASKAGDPGSLTFTRGSPLGSLLVAYSLSGTAIAGSDYVAPGGSITFPNGETSVVLTLTPIPDDLYTRGTKSIIATLNSSAAYAVGSPSSAQINLAGGLSNPTKAPNSDALNLATSWLGNTPLSSEIPLWDQHLSSANSSSLGANTTWAGLRIGSGAQAPGGDISITGAFTLALTGSLDLGTTRNLTVATNSLTFAGLTGSGSLRITNSAGIFNSAITAGGLDFNGRLELRGGSNSIQTSTGAAGTSGNFYLLNSSSQSQSSGSRFALDTGASVTDRKDFAWIIDNGNVLTLSSLSGHGAIRNDAGGITGSTVTRRISVDQSGSDTTFNGALLSHTSSAGAVRAISFTKDGSSKLTLAGFIGKQTTSSGSAAAAVNLIVNNGTLEVSNASNSTTTNTPARNTTGTVTMNGGTFAFANNAWPNTSVGAFVMNGGTLQWSSGNTQDISSRLAAIPSGKSAVFDTNGNAITFGTALTGSGGFTKTGAGSLTLTTSNPLAGTAIVQNGTLILNGALTGAGAAMIASSGTLTGGGSVSGPVSSSGSIQPGNGIGTLTFGALSLGNGASISWQISDWNGVAGPGFDTISASALDLTASPSSPITLLINEQSLTRFSNSPATFPLIQTSGGITGFSASKFIVNSSGFTSGGGVWNVQLSTDGKTLELVYSGATPDSNGNGLHDTWEIAEFGNAATGANPANGDADLDGFSNLIEYALDTRPTSFSSSPLTVDRVTLSGSTFLRMSVPKNPNATQLNYLVEFSSDLSPASWSAAGAVIEENTASLLVVRDGLSGQPSRFVRLRVVAP